MSFQAELNDLDFHRFLTEFILSETKDRNDKSPLSS